MTPVTRQFCTGLCLFLAATWFGSPAKADPTSPGEALSLLSYNVRIDFDGRSWPRREPALKRFLTQRSDDLILFQEASEFMITRYGEFLPDYGLVQGERSDGGSGEQGWYEFVPIFYRSDRLRLVDSGSFWISDTPSVPGSNLENTKFHARVLTWAVFASVSDSRLRLAAANVHIHGKRADDALEIILREMTRCCAGIPTVYAGDFNATADTAFYQAATADDHHGLIDAALYRRGEAPAVTVIGAGQSVPSAATDFKRGGQARRIDYIFTQAAIGVEHYVVHPVSVTGNLFASDHFALSAVLRLARDASADPESAESLRIEGMPGTNRTPQSEAMGQ